MEEYAQKYRGSTIYVHVLAELVRAAQYRGVTTYQDIALIMGLPLTGSYMGKETGQVLGEIAQEEVKSGRPILTAVVVGVNGRPGQGFYDLAHRSGRARSASEDQEFWKRELESVYATWKRPLRVAKDE
jgi:hypothetical protein